MIYKAKEIVEGFEKASLAHDDRCPSNRNIVCPKSAIIDEQKNEITLLHKQGRIHRTNLMSTLLNEARWIKKEKRKSFLLGWTIATLVSAAMQVVWFTKDIWLGWF